MSEKKLSTDKMLTVFSIAVDVYRDTIRKLQLMTIALLMLYVVTLGVFCFLLYQKPATQACVYGTAIPITATAMHKLTGHKTEKRDAYV
jgi:hypothetical protein